MSAPQTAQRRISGVCFLDAANITSVLYHAGHSAYESAAAMDLIRFQRDLVAKYGPIRCHYVVRANGRGRSGRAEWVRQQGWRFVEATDANMINRDPTDVYVITGILAATSQLKLTGPRVLVVVSNDGGYAAPLRTFAEAGGRVAVWGFPGSISQQLRDLVAHPRCAIFDLRPYLYVGGTIAPTPQRRIH